MLWTVSVWKKTLIRKKIYQGFPFVMNRLGFNSVEMDKYNLKKRTAFSAGKLGKFVSDRSIFGWCGRSLGSLPQIQGNQGKSSLLIQIAKGKNYCGFQG